MKLQAVDTQQFGICSGCNRPLSQDRSKQLTWIVNGIAVTVVLLALGFIWCVRNPYAIQNFVASRVSVNPGKVVSVPARSPMFSNTKRVTWEQFKALKVGMDLKQVTRVLGSQGTRSARTKIKGVSTQLYQWQNEDGSNITVEFRGDKLAFKANLKLQPDAHVSSSKPA